MSFFLDSAGNEIEEKIDETDIYFDEDESEEQWRKRRHERELFLKKVSIKFITF